MNQTARAASQLALPVLLFALLPLLGQPSAAAPQALINVRLNDDLPPAGDLEADDPSFQVSPDSQYAVYAADAEIDDALDLYSVHVSGVFDPVRLNEALLAGQKVARFRIAPDSRHVVYLAPQDTAGVDELYVVPIEGGMSTKLNGPLAPGGDVVHLEITPDGARVIYLADRQTDDVFELYSVPIGGGTSTKLNG
ncbi:MAG TPA: hypothetical protein VF434_01830, partial [Promineifilum sp.]